MTPRFKCEALRVFGLGTVRTMSPVNRLRARENGIHCLNHFTQLTEDGAIAELDEQLR